MYESIMITNKNSERLLEEINELGKEGWQLVSVYFTKETQTLRYHTAWLSVKTGEHIKSTPHLEYYRTPEARL